MTSSPFRFPPTLPPVSTTSRSSSPAAGTKRKLPASADSDAVKRPRTGSTSDRTHQQPAVVPVVSHQSHYQQTTQPPAPSISTRQSAATTSRSASRMDTCEDGEVSEDIAASSSAAPIPSPSTNVPIRRPKKGKPMPQHFDLLHNKYLSHGRMLKYSGDARFLSTYPPSHKEYRPLLEPPNANTPYHKHGGLIARLELLDALVCFTYGMWNRDYGRRTWFKDSWKSIDQFLSWIKRKWQVEDGANDSEKAFIGLIWMIEAFIKGRKMAFTIRVSLDEQMSIVQGEVAKKIAAAAAGAGDTDMSFSGSKAPPMLPSPTSTNSTPVNREDGTPSASAARTAAAAATAAHRQQSYTGPVPFRLLPERLQTSTSPISAEVMTAMAAVTEPIGVGLVTDMKDLIHEYKTASHCIDRAHSTLSLPILRRCFPHTWMRMMHTTLLHNEEHEPDFEDEEGELYWPDQCLNGEGIGWVCLLGRAMIQEFGKSFGYKGLSGVVIKEKNAPSTTPAHPLPQRPDLQPSQRSSR